MRGPAGSRRRRRLLWSGVAIAGLVATVLVARAPTHRPEPGVPAGTVPAAAEAGPTVESGEPATEREAQATQPKASRRDGRASMPEPERRAVRVPERGSGRFVTPPPVAATESALASATLTYSVQVEADLPFRARAVAAYVDRVLGDDRSWTAAGHRLVRSRDADVRIRLATPETTDRLCLPLDTVGRLSCRNGTDVILNGWRWAHGAEGYEGRLADYRAYLVNHEIGHLLGYGHVSCPRVGALAPVMLQQTKSLDGCRANAWPARVDLRG